MKSKHLLPLALLLTLPVNALEIYPQVSSTIVSMKALGSEVNQGDVLIKLDDRQAQLKLKYLQAILSIKQQAFDDVKLHLDQTQELYDRLVASHRDLEEAQLDFNAKQRELEVQQLKISIQEIELEKYQIRAPSNASIEAIPNPRNTTNAQNPKVLMILKTQ